MISGSAEISKSAGNCVRSSIDPISPSKSSSPSRISSAISSKIFNSFWTSAKSGNSSRPKCSRSASTVPTRPCKTNRTSWWPWTQSNYYPAMRMLSSASSSSKKCRRIIETVLRSPKKLTTSRIASSQTQSCFSMMSRKTKPSGRETPTSLSGTKSSRSPSTFSTTQRKTKPALATLTKSTRHSCGEKPANSLNFYLWIESSSTCLSMACTTTRLATSSLWFCLPRTNQANINFSNSRRKFLNGFWTNVSKTSATRKYSRASSSSSRKSWTSRSSRIMNFSKISKDVPTSSSARLH